MNRISVLVAAGALGAAALTGCSSSASKSAGNGASTVGGTSSAAGSTGASTGSSGPGGASGSGSASTSASSPAGSTNGDGQSNNAASSSASGSSGSGSSHDNGGGACTSAEMPSGTWHGVQGSEGAGHVAADIALQNTSGHSCTVSGFPNIALQASNNSALPSHVIKYDSVPVTTITVAPGAWVHSEIRYSADMPGPGEPESGQCEPTTVHAIAQLPGDSAWVRVTMDTPTPVCEKGEIQAKPFVSGKSSPTGG